MGKAENFPEREVERAERLTMCYTLKSRELTQQYRSLMFYRRTRKDPRETCALERWIIEIGEVKH